MCVLFFCRNQLRRTQTGNIVCRPESELYNNVKDSERQRCTMEQKIRIFTQSVKWSARAQHTAKRIKNEKQNEENKEENCWSAARTLGGCHRSLSWRNQINAIIAKSKNEAHFSTQYVQSLRTLKLKRFPIQFGKFLNSTMSPDTWHQECYVPS